MNDNNEFTVSGKIVDLLNAAQVPLFLFGRDHDGGTSTGISCDNEMGGAMAARFFLRAKRTRLSYIGKKARTFSDINRRQGFADEIVRLGAQLHSEADELSTYEGGRNAATKLFSAGTVPDAVFCFNDTMAFGVLQAALEFNLRVPHDVAIIGFDDQPMASWHAYELTTIGYDLHELAKLATTKILDAINGVEVTPRSFFIQPKLVIRRTTPPGE